ncbi:MAG: hypothetical protein CVV49_00125 [Spirochaetae bacterium HGW-Spirochaetae-5]|nr:MAG: hypothetical protein CVV49_00125 [Spirochaetae bacterium HGW-Spirochaetae-5]
MFNLLFLLVCMVSAVFGFILGRDLNNIKKWKQQERKKNIEVIGRIALKAYAYIKKQKKILH